MHDEWELLCISDEIEPGDLIDVEDDEGDTIQMVFVRHEGKGVILKGPNGEVSRFSSATLEEIGGYRNIIGKSQDA